MSRAPNTAKLVDVVQHAAADNFLRRICRTIERHQMLVAGERVVVGLSGGPDSVALLAALAQMAPRLDVRLMAAHLNHGLRGAEAHGDQEFARELAARLGIDCEVGKVALSHGGNFEARARAARYEFLQDVARRAGAEKIATGHTVDDQAETVVMRLLRGSGWDGLRGISPVRQGRIIRPLIDCCREDVMGFLSACDLPFRFDSSNRQRRFLRNRVRQDLIPVLASFNPNVGRTLANTATLMAAGASVLDRSVAAALSSVQRDDRSLSVEALRLLGRDLELLVVHAWLRELRGGVDGLQAAHFEAVLALVRAERPNVSAALPGGVAVYREYDSLRCLQIAPVVDHRAAGEQRLPSDGVLDLPTGWRFIAERVEAGNLPIKPTTSWVLHADDDTVAPGLVVRAYRLGDRVRSLGLNGGRRKLQDVFIDRKVPRRSRASYPVLVHDDEVLWVPGLARGSSAIVSASTRFVLRVTAQPPAMQESGIAGGNHVC